MLSGGIVLPFGRVEVEPALHYDYARHSGLAFVASGVATHDVQQENAQASLGLRSGLPWQMQLELFAPYRYDGLDDVTAGVRSRAERHGLGDVVAGLTKQFFNDRSAHVGLVANVAYQWSTGKSSLGASAAGPSPSLGVGYDSCSATLRGVKGMDPLVFVGSFTHAFNFPARVDGVRFEPADTNAADLRAILAASPDLSLRAGISASRTGEIRVDHATVAGSSQMIALLQLGGSVVLTRRLLLDFAVGAGLTEDSPDFSVDVSLPFRF